MHVIARKKILDFELIHPDAKSSLDAWFAFLEKGTFYSSYSLREQFCYLDILPGDRAVFNIKGNTYRIIVKINYRTQVVFIRFIGNHRDYNKINAETI